MKLLTTLFLISLSAFSTNEKCLEDILKLGKSYPKEQRRKFRIYNSRLRLVFDQNNISNETLIKAINEQAQKIQSLKNLDASDEFKRKQSYVWSMEGNTLIATFLERHGIEYKYIVQRLFKFEEPKDWAYAGEIPVQIKLSKMESLSDEQMLAIKDLLFITNTTEDIIDLINFY